MYIPFCTQWSGVASQRSDTSGPDTLNWMEQMDAKAMWVVVDGFGKQRGNVVGSRQSAVSAKRRFRGQGYDVTAWIVRPYQFQEAPLQGPAMAAPFETRDNGVHRYFEDKDVLVLCNHGSPWWTGLAKIMGGYQCITVGDDPAVVMEVTREGRATRMEDRQAQLEQEFNARQSALPLLRGARPS